LFDLVLSRLRLAMKSLFMEETTTVVHVLIAIQPRLHNL
jgi:hypothetical protein